MGHVADIQKSAWNQHVKSGGQASWIDSGLWRYSRHPNYFGEIVAWQGMAIIAMGGAVNWTRACLALVSPLWSGFFLVFTSLMLLEKRVDAKFAKVPGYDRYKQRTPVLVPW